VISKPIRIEVVTAPDLPEVEHDSDQIHQVVLNLLLNAVQSIDGNGYITVTVNSKDDCATVIVTDTGRGMSSQQLTQIFRPFYTTRASGTGLGLSLVRRIIDEHNGKINVTSELGTGSTFQVLLPFSQIVEPVEAA
jgi:two-component system, NtrC family, sensor histidine kinase HydH